MVRVLLLWLGGAALASAKEEQDCVKELANGNAKNVCDDKFCLKDPRIAQKCDLMGADEHDPNEGKKVKEGGANCFDHKDNDGDGAYYT